MDPRFLVAYLEPLTKTGQALAYDNLPLSRIHREHLHVRVPMREELDLALAQLARQAGKVLGIPIISNILRIEETGQVVQLQLLDPERWVVMETVSLAAWTAGYNKKSFHL